MPAFIYVFYVKEQPVLFNGLQMYEVLCILQIFGKKYLNAI